MLKWTQGELRAIDTKIRKTLTKFGYHHPNSNVHCLYLSRSCGGRGVICAMDCYIQECTALAVYIKGTVEEGKDSLVQIVAENEGKQIYGIMSYLAGLQKNRNVLETREYH